MSARKDITKKFAKQYAKVGRKEKMEILDALVKATGWHRDHARRAIREASVRKGSIFTSRGSRGRGSTPTTLWLSSRRCGG